MMAAAQTTRAPAKLCARPGRRQGHSRTIVTNAASDSVLTTSQTRTLGASGVEVAPIGLGIWSWGETLYWNSGWDGKKEALARGAYKAYIEGCGDAPAWLDTAEVYGGLAGGESERILGRFCKEGATFDDVGKPVSRPAIATKFAALPWRLGKESVVEACRASLSRLQVSSVELYQLHWPGLWQNDDYLDGLAELVNQGLVKSVGVSNYNEKRLRKAHARLSELGIPLASNQVHYNLLYRAPEMNGVKEACKELGVTLVAYSPLAQGILSE